MAVTILSNFIVQQWEDWWFGLITTPTPPANFYVRLWTTSPGPGNSGGVEVSATGTNYVALVIPNNPANWAASANRQKQNSTSFNPWFTAGAVIPPIAAVTIYDAATAGNLQCINEIASGSQVGIAVGNVVTFNIGSMSLTIN